MVVYHGTTIENLRSIKRFGLRKTSFVSQNIRIATNFGVQRSQWNQNSFVLLRLNTKYLKRVRENEFQLTENITQFEIMEK